jgi:hypothetical protein
MKVEVVLSNSFAFGGNCTSLVFGKYLREGSQEISVAPSLIACLR